MATTNALDKANAIIRELLDALDSIERTGNIHYAHGVALQAAINANAQLVRNADGYRVVKG